MMVNVPDGSTYATVDERVAEGTIVANRPTTSQGAIYGGGRWRFSNGRLTSFRYQTGEGVFRASYRAGTGPKDRIAMLEVGLDPSVHGAPFLEENELGAVSVFVGANQGSGGKNRASFGSYVTLAGADLSVDGSPVLKGGRFV
jgi:hypothetical protein